MPHQSYMLLAFPLVVVMPSNELPTNMRGSDPTGAVSLSGNP